MGVWLELVKTLDLQRKTRLSWARLSSGAPDRIRTYDPGIRKQTYRVAMYPVFLPSCRDFPDARFCFM